ncbi:substance-P receptor-like [Paramacrobiotus metropolitanus]|uniref:substance-P receptor-like n=1 Tax=Paramacrobiotus metropolitanus TaxID=2943436 RepID=UPI002445ABB6|nr:substance-P receptor-like [Paramacrobiotus metropolitanus]
MSFNCVAVPANVTCWNNLTTNRSFGSLPARWIQPWAATYLFLCFEGAVGNLLIVGLIFSNSKMRTGCGVLIGHCLIAYSVLCGFSFPIVATSVYRKQMFRWQMDPKDCRPYMWIQMGCRFAAYWFDLYIAINRVVALCFPHKYRQFSRARTEILVVSVLWVAAFLLSGFGFFNFGMVFIMLPLGTCATLPVGRVGSAVVLIGFYGPGALTAGAYLFVYAKIVRRKQQTEPERTTNDNKAKKQTTRKRMITTNMMCASFVWTAACSMILPVMINMINVAETDLRYPLIVIWLAAVQLVGYASNPVSFIPID